MSRMIEPVPQVGISAADMSGAGDMLVDYHSLFTPLLAVGSKVSVPSGIYGG